MPGEKNKEEKLRVEVGTDPIIFEIVSEPYVVFTFKGYIPAVDIQIREENAPRVMFIGASSLSRGIEERRVKNDGKFKGICLRIRKESEDRYAKYIVESVSKDIIVGEDLG